LAFDNDLSRSYNPPVSTVTPFIENIETGKCYFDQSEDSQPRSCLADRQTPGFPRKFNAAPFSIFCDFDQEINSFEQITMQVATNTSY